MTPDHKANAEAAESRLAAVLALLADRERLHQIARESWSFTVTFERLRAEVRAAIAAADVSGMIGRREINV